MTAAALPVRGRRAAHPTARSRAAETVVRADLAGQRFLYWLDFEQRRWDAARAAHGDVPAGTPLADPTEENR